MRAVWLRILSMGISIAACSALLVAGTPPPGPPPLYAYATPTELTVMRGTELVVREPVIFSPDNLGTVWTLDSRYAALISDSERGLEDSYNRMLVVIDSYTGSVRRLPCAYCTSIAPIGKSKLIVSQSDFSSGYVFDSILRFDLSSYKPPGQMSMYRINEPRRQVFFLGGLPGQALLFSLDNQGTQGYFTLEEGGTMLPASEFTSSGQFTQLDASLRNTDTVAVARTVAGSLLFASGSIYSSSNAPCGRYSEVFLTSATTRQSVSTNMSAVKSVGSASSEDTELLVSSAWWDEDGYLHATATVRTCPQSGEPSERMAEMMLKDGAWVGVPGDGSSLEVVKLDDGAKVILDVTKEPGARGLVLSVAKDDRLTKIADGVVHISAPTGVRQLTAHNMNQLCRPGDRECVGKLR